MKKIIIAVSIITAVLLIYIWFIARPNYKASVLSEQLTVIRQLQKSCINNIDHTIIGWSRIPRFIISHVIERPNEGEAILRMMMTLHPEIIQIRIHSFGPSDELVSRDTSYPMLDLQFPDSTWEYSKVDSALQIAWINRTEEPLHLLAMRMRFQAHRIPFTLTIVWNTKQFNDIIAGLPLGKDYSVSIHSSSGVIVQNVSTFKMDKAYTPPEISDTVQIVHEETDSWHVLKSTFQTARIWMVVAIPEKVFTKHLGDFLLYSALLVAGPILIMSILGWLLSFQIKRFIKKTGTSDNTDCK